MRVGVEVAELGVVTGAVDKLLLGLGVKFEGAHEALPDLIGSRGRLSGGDAAGHLTDLYDGKVLAIRGGAMAGIAMYVQAALAGALFTHVETHRAGQVAAAGFR